MQDKGYDIHFTGKKVYVKHPSWKQTRQIGVRSNKLYRLQIETLMALVSSNIEDKKGLNELWHRRMGHFHHGALKVLRETVDGAPVLSTKHDDVCQGCVLRKYAKETFPKSENKAASIL